jgi:mycothiol system anti-sigma-R factor
MNPPHDALAFPQARSCLDVQARSFEYLDDELPSDDRREIAAHLTRCAACRHAFDRDATFRQFLRTAAVRDVAPTALRTRLLDALRRASEDAPA